MNLESKDTHQHTQMHTHTQYKHFTEQTIYM